MTQMIHFDCPCCCTRQKAPAHLRGSQVNCQDCGRVVVVHPTPRRRTSASAPAPSPAGVPGNITCGKCKHSGCISKHSGRYWCSWCKDWAYSPGAAKQTVSPSSVLAPAGGGSSRRNQNYCGMCGYTWFPRG